MINNPLKPIQTKVTSLFCKYKEYKDKGTDMPVNMYSVKVKKLSDVHFNSDY